MGFYIAMKKTKLRTLLVGRWNQNKNDRKKGNPERQMPYVLSCMWI